MKCMKYLMQEENQEDPLNSLSSSNAERMWYCMNTNEDICVHIVYENQGSEEGSHIVELSNQLLIDEPRDEHSDELDDDATNLQENGSDIINLKNYKNICNAGTDFKNGPYVKIQSAKDYKIVNKSSLCWSLSSQTSRVDRLQRFKNKSSTSRATPLATPKNIINLVVECYYAIYYDDTWYIGRVIKNTENRTEIKFLKASLEVVDPEYIFYGPVNMLGNEPFEITLNDRRIIESKYKQLKYCKDAR